MPPLPVGEGIGVAELIAGEATAGRFALVELTIARGAEPPRHIHHWEDEMLYFLAGDVELLLGEDRLLGSVGTAVFVPRGVEHGITVRSDDARILSAFLPAGFDGFYRETADLGPDALDRWIATAARYGCEITGPPPRPAAATA